MYDLQRKLTIMGESMCISTQLSVNSSKIYTVLQLNLGPVGEIWFISLPMSAKSTKFLYDFQWNSIIVGQFWYNFHKFQYILAVYAIFQTKFNNCRRSFVHLLSRLNRILSFVRFAMKFANCWRIVVHWDAIFSIFQ